MGEKIMLFHPLPARRSLVYALACMVGLAASGVYAQQAPEVAVSYSNGQFQPSELRVPADKPFILRVKNLDAKAMEFESKSLRVEKVIPARGEGTINIRALKAGRYEFYDDFNEKARGAVTAQ